jgi:hypothetical protein
MPIRCELFTRHLERLVQKAAAAQPTKKRAG